MFNPDSDGFSPREHGRDRVFNSETRRALRYAARLLGMGVLGALAAIIILAVAAATTVGSGPWQLSVAATAVAALALPVAVPYVMLRVYGLNHPDVLYVGRQAYREALAEITALGGMQTAASAFNDAESDNDDTTATDEDEGEHEDEGEGKENRTAETTESAHPAETTAQTNTEP